MAIDDNLNNAKENAKGLNEELDSSKSIFGDLRDTLESINAELGKKINRVADARKAYTSLESIAQQLKNQEEGSVRLTDKQLDQLASKAKIQNQEIKDAAEKLDIERINRSLGEDILKLKEENYLAAVDRLEKTKEISREEAALLRGKQSGFEIENDTVEKVQSAVNKRKKENKLLGISGGLLKGINEIAKGFGGAFGLKEIQEKMVEVANGAVKVGENGEVITKPFARLKVLAAGIKETLDQSVNTITSIEVISASLTKSFLEIQKVQTEFRNLTGQSADNFENLNSDLITATEQIQTLTQLTEKFGINANAAFSPKTIAETTVLTQNMGVSAEAAGNLAMFSEAYDNNMENVTNQLTRGTSEFNATNKAAVVNRQVIEDVGNASGNLAANFAKNPEALAEASRAARDLGLSLKEVEGIADSLLNFESSISAELEAELISGRQINLERARSAALANDMETLSNEIANNQAILNAFATGNRIEQNKIAKALGLSADQMAKIIFRQKLNNDLTVEQARQAANISKEEATRLATQMQFQKAIQKVSQAVASLLDAFTPIINNQLALQSTIVLLSTAYAVKFVGSLKFAAKQLGLLNIKQVRAIGLKIKDIGLKIKDRVVTLANAAAQRASNIATSIRNKIQVRAIGLKIRDIALKIKDRVVTLANAAAQRASNIAMGINNVLMNTTLGRYIALGAAKLLDTARTWLGVGATTAQTKANFFLASSQRILGTTGPRAGSGMASAGAGLGAFGTSAAVAIPIILAIGAALLMASPAIYAFSLVVKELGKIILGIFKTLPDIITAVAKGFTMFLDAITFEKAAALPLVGLGLVSLAAGVMAMALTLPFLPLAALGILGISYALTPLIESIAEAGPGLESLNKSLISMTSTIPLLYSVAGGLGAIAAGLESIAVAGIAAIPALTALGTLTPLVELGGLFENDDSGEDNSEIVTILKEIKNEIQQGGDVYLDGQKVGKTLSLSATRIG